MKKELVLTIIEDNIAIIAIDRPALNALSSGVYGELSETF